MNAVDRDMIRDAALEYVRPNNCLALAALILDTVLFFTASAVAVLSTSFAIKAAAAIAAGTAISMLFILGHDANHRSLFSRKWLNAVASRWTFLPCLHNATLWRYQHNRLHHQHTNVKNENSYSPLSVKEYRSLRPWRRILERVYRNVLGFGIYYLIERWWKHKFYPRASTPRGQLLAARLDFGVIVIWVAGFLGTIVWIDATFGADQPFMAVLFGALIPFFVWNQLMGLTAFLQHTHPRAMWTDSLSSDRPQVSQIEHTILVRYPRWYDYLSHNIMLHPAHHVNPRIPWFRLFDAQERFNALAADDMIIEKVGVRYVLRLMRECQLYDYEKHIWLDFAGNPTDSNITSMVGVPAS